jgi:hypothetical protein
MHPIFLFPAAIFSFLGGAVLGRSRKGLSMLPPERPSPLRGVPALSWERFVSVMVVAPRQHVTTRGRMGMFGLDARRLGDVGFMQNPRKVTVGAETGVWTGEWRKPLDAAKFLSSAGAQYEAFSRSMRRLTPRVAPSVGAVIGGRPATLSGLLAAGHLAGEEGILGWVADPAVREKFKATTANYERANNIF